MNRFISSKKIIAGTLLTLLLGTLVFSGNARAENGIGIFNDDSGVPWSSSGGTGVVERTVGSVLYIALTASNRIIVFLISALQAGMYFKIDTAFPVVGEMAKIVRNFANMLISLVLIVSLIALIFNQKDYAISGSLALNLVKVAFFMNFALVLMGLVLNATQVVNDTFLANIGNFQDRLGAALNPKVLVGLPADTSEWEAGVRLNPLNVFSDLTSSMIVQLFFTLGFSVMLAFSLLVPVVFVFARIPAIMLLAVFAAGAWMLDLFPGAKTSGFGSSEWIKQFSGWTFFLPVYLFILYLGLYFLSFQKTILASIDRTGGSGLIGFANITLSTVFFYGVTGMIFVFGTAAALKVSFMGGTQAGVVAGWARGKVGKLWFGARPALNVAQGTARIAAGTGIGAVAGFKQEGTITGALKGTVGGLFNSREMIAGVKKGVEARYGQLKQEGLPTRFGQTLFGGTRAVDRLSAQARALASLGLTEREIEAQQALVSGSVSEMNRLDEQFKLGQVTVEQLKAEAAKYGANSPRGFAYRQILAKLGEADKDLFMATIRELQGNAKAIQEFTGKIRDESKVLTKITATEFGEAMNIMGGSKSGNARAFLKDIEKIRPDFAFDYRANNNMLPSNVVIATTADRDREKEAAIGKSLGDLKVVASMPIDLWNDPLFQNALVAKFNSPNLNPDTRKNMVNSLQEHLQQAPGGSSKLSILKARGIF